MAYSDFEDRAVELWSEFWCQWQFEHAADLNHQKSGYFSWWLQTHRDRLFSCDTLQEFEDGLEGAAILADNELDMVREISDTALELRWMRKLQCQKHGLTSAFL